MKKVIFFIGVLVSILVVNPGFAQIAVQSPFNYFMNIDGIPGDSLYQPRPVPPGAGPGWIDVLSLKEGITGLSRSTAGGPRSQFADLTITKRIDRASVPLREHLAGQQIGNVFLSCVLKGSSQQEVYRISLSRVFVSGLKLTGDGTGVLEEVSFAYGTIEWIYYLLNPGGTRQGEMKSKRFTIQ